MAVPRNFGVGVTFGAVFAIFTAMVAFAGDLNPPAGPITSTMKTLTEVEPRKAINATNTPGDADSIYKIIARGSYYLTGNMIVVIARHGIEVAASNVTIDLNGFDIVGVNVAGGFDGVSATLPTLSNIAVVNGSIRNWGGDGVDLGTSAAFNCRLTDLLTSGNLGSGIHSGNATTITNCSSYANTGNGFLAAVGCTISNCTAYANSDGGITASSDCIISNCSAYDNSTTGIRVSTGSLIADCIASSNLTGGIMAISECVIRGNSCSTNGGGGIHTTGSRNRIESNNCTNNSRGILADFGDNFIVKNTCGGNGINWVLAANNYFGPIIFFSNVTPAVNGNTAASTLTTTDANANFSY